MGHSTLSPPSGSAPATHRTTRHILHEMSCCYLLARHSQRSSHRRPFLTSRCSPAAYTRSGRPRRRSMLAMDAGSAWWILRSRTAGPRVKMMKINSVLATCSTAHSVGSEHERREPLTGGERRHDWGKATGLSCSRSLAGGASNATCRKVVACGRVEQVFRCLQQETCPCRGPFADGRLGCSPAACAGVAQRQSSCFVNSRPWVRVPPPAPPLPSV